MEPAEIFVRGWRKLTEKILKKLRRSHLLPQEALLLLYARSPWNLDKDRQLNTLRKWIEWSCDGKPTPIRLGRALRRLEYGRRGGKEWGPEKLRMESFRRREGASAWTVTTAKERAANARQYDREQEKLLEANRLARISVRLLCGRTIETDLNEIVEKSGKPLAAVKRYARTEKDDLTNAEFAELSIKLCGCRRCVELHGRDS